MRDERGVYGGEAHEGCACGHKLDFCHKVNAGRWCGTDAPVADYRAALIRCAELAGADLSGGIPTWPSLQAFAVRAVEQLRKDYDESLHRHWRTWKPRLLDLFCGAGGCSVGYHRAGFNVVGVDIRPQPRYPFEFIQADALEVLRRGLPYEFHTLAESFDAIHASPPCQHFTAYRRTGNVHESPNLIPETRALLEATGLSYVIENVATARAELHAPTLICGSMFDPPMEVERHRLFETNWPLTPPMWPCRHKLNGRDRYPGGRSKERTGSSRGLVRATVEVGSWDIPLVVQQRAMGIDWMQIEELSEAIPPAYTDLVGAQLLVHLRAKKAA